MRKLPDKKTDKYELELTWSTTSKSISEGKAEKLHSETLSMEEYIDFLEDIAPSKPNYELKKVYQKRFEL